MLIKKKTYKNIDSPHHFPQCNETAFQIIHQRRSALAMDGVTEMARSVFFGILERLQVEQNAMFFECLPWAANVSLFLFVHRVRDVQPGLYVLVRDSSHELLIRGPLFSIPVIN
jgi:hypothetical protein